VRKTGWIFLAAGAVVLAGLFVMFRPAPPPAAPGEAAAPGVPPAAPLPMAIQLVVKDGRLASGPAVTQVAQGQQVVIDVVADQADELHLHGYDLKVDLVPGVPASLRFVADKTGRFDYELHRAHAEIGAIEVQPR
jgi:FtsP/CotA-like multicopper oxidase with cupredoxin domain